MQKVKKGVVPETHSLVLSTHSLLQARLAPSGIQSPSRLNVKPRTGGAEAMVWERLAAAMVCPSKSHCESLSWHWLLPRHVTKLFLCRTGDCTTRDLDPSGCILVSAAVR
uniref:Uncharacterized protein n=1 Tax=Anguilla anguilla TaxID=7936 RepID=A0A0E9RS67_ANGAN